MRSTFCCPSIGLCEFDENRTEMRSRYLLFCVVRLCRTVRGPRRAVQGCAPAGTMCARHVLAEPRVVCVDVNRTRNGVLVYTLLCSTAVLPCTWAYMYNPRMCACWDCVRLTCAGRAWGCVRSTLIEPAVLPCTWAYIWYPKLCSWRDNVRSTCAGRA